MPLTTFGDLKIVAAQDIGRLGPAQSEPVTFHWSLWWHLAGVVPWLVVIPFLFIKGNRNRQALMVMIPLFAIALILMLIWVALRILLEDMPGAGAVIQIPIWLLLGVTVLWLVSYKLGSASRVAAFFGAAAIMAGVGFAIVVCTAVLKFSVLAAVEAIASGIAYGFLSVAMLLGLMFAGLFCRTRYTAVRFTLWLLSVFVGVCLAVSLPFAAFAALFSAFFEESFAAAAIPFVTILGVGCVIGLALFAILMPFMILTFASGLYRERFYDVFRLQGMLTEPAAVPASASLQMEREADNEQTFRPGAP